MSRRQMEVATAGSVNKVEPITFEESSGNVFADLGNPNPREHLQKVLLLQRLDALLQERSLGQVQAAKLLGMDQPSLSRLLRGAVRGVSLEKLMQLLAQLDQHVLIVVAPRGRGSDRLQLDLGAATAEDPALVVRVEPSPQGQPGRRGSRPHRPRSTAPSAQTQLRSA